MLVSLCSFMLHVSAQETFGHLLHSRSENAELMLLHIYFSFLQFGMHVFDIHLVACVFRSSIESLISF